MSKRCVAGAAFQVSVSYDPYKELSIMNRYTRDVVVLVAMALVGLIGCTQESPAGKATEAAGQAAVDAMKSPMDKARQTEGTLEKSAEQTAGKVKEASQ